MVWIKILILMFTITNIKTVTIFETLLFTCVGRRLHCANFVTLQTMSHDFLPGKRVDITENSWQHCLCDAIANCTLFVKRRGWGPYIEILL